MKSALRLAGIGAAHPAAAAALVQGGLLPLLLQALGAARKEADTLEVSGEQSLMPLLCRPPRLMRQAFSWSIECCVLASAGGHCQC